MSELPTREAVREAWKPFETKYDKYLAESNWDSWLMQDKIIHAYMTGRLVDREAIDHEAAERALTEWVDDGMDGFWSDAVELIVDAALGGNDE